MHRVYVPTIWLTTAVSSSNGFYSLDFSSHILILPIYVELKTLACMFWMGTQRLNSENKQDKITSLAMCFLLLCDVV